MPSRFVVRCLSELGTQAPSAKAIDVPCGYGRHSFAAIEHGYKVTAVDVSSDRVAYVRDVAAGLAVAKRIVAVTRNANDIDFATFGPFDLAIVTDFSDLALLARLPPGVVSDGHLIFETPAGHGGNWQELPEAGAVRDALCESFDLVRYIERPVGPFAAGRVTVKCLARRR
jgi:SAM-dependent methyltransferase